MARLPERRQRITALAPFRPERAGAFQAQDPPVLPSRAAPGRLQDRAGTGPGMF